jgi:hypothetical protein
MYCLFCVVLCTVCMYMCTVLLPPGGYPIAVKYIIYHISYLIHHHITLYMSYNIMSSHIVSYHIISYNIIVSTHYRRFGTTYRCHPQGPRDVEFLYPWRCDISWPLTMGHIVTFEDETIRFASKRRQCITTTLCVISQKIADLSLNVVSGIPLTDRSAEWVCLDEVMMDCSTSEQASVPETSTCSEEWPACVRLTHSFAEPATLCKTLTSCCSKCWVKGCWNL